MKAGELCFGVSPIRKGKPSADFVSLKQLRRMRGSEQVAAVCYRIGKRGLEFLLVRTRGGRWTFPKGSVESGLTHAQAAALEAFEEAGVHGRMEEEAFARYVRIKPEPHRGASQIEVVINAHLCEVTHLESPEEANRHPTWFPAEKAQKRLREERPAEYGEDLARIVDRAIVRIQRLYRANQAARVVVGRAEIIAIDHARVSEFGSPKNPQLHNRAGRRSRKIPT
jgi:8-oxo-dGTP pyrophosphatase MutT (NUDIX family)